MPEKSLPVEFSYAILIIPVAKIQLAEYKSPSETAKGIGGRQRNNWDTEKRRNRK